MRAVQARPVEVDEGVENTVKTIEIELKKDEELIVTGANSVHISVLWLDPYGNLQVTRSTGREPREILLEHARWTQKSELELFNRRKVKKHERRRTATEAA